MRNWRVVTAVAAVVLAVVAGLLVWRYTDEADDRARESQQPVEVLVAAEDIAQGTSGEQPEDLFGVEEYPDRLVTDDMLRPGQEETVEGKFADSDVPAGTPIRATTFTEQATPDGHGLGLADGMQAISISVDATHGVAEFPRPGDTVNVMVGTEVKDLANPDAQPLKTSGFLLAGVKVLAVGQTTAAGDQRRATTDTNGDGSIDADDEPAEGQAEQRGLITLEVDARQGLQLAQASLVGGLYLTLNSPDFEPGGFTTPEEIVEIVNLFDQPLVKLDEVQAAMRGLPR